MGQILDVGCGPVPKGNINCDVEKYFHKVFVRCDGQHLPFKDESFDTVYSSHVIEHVKNPSLFFKEMYRVSRFKVIIRTPHLFSYASRGLPLVRRIKYHIHYWTRSFFKQLLANYKYKLRIRPNLETEYWFIPLKCIEIVVEVQKNAEETR